MQQEAARFIIASMYESISVRLSREKSSPSPDMEKIRSWKRQLEMLANCRNHIDTPQVLQKIERVYSKFLKNS